MGALALLLLALTGLTARAADVHNHVLVFIPGFEASALDDEATLPEGGNERCLWGPGADPAHYLELSLPNRLLPRSMPTLDSLDLYAGLNQSLTTADESLPSFRPYKPGTDFFIFPYDWRQGIGDETAPALADALVGYARLYAAASGRRIQDTQFVIVAHGSGGLVIRTLLSQKPGVAANVKRLYLVATPNLGTTHALMALVAGRPTPRKGQPPTHGLLLQVPGGGVSAADQRRVATTLAGLYQLLPVNDPRWVHINREGSSRRLSQDDLLTLGTWRRFWPMDLTSLATPEDLTARLDTPPTTPDSPAPPAGDNALLKLQQMLARTRDWRLQVGTLAYTERLLTQPGETPRLHVVYAKGVQTPNGMILEDTDTTSKARFTYDVFGDGDGIVTVESALEGLKAPERTHVLDGIAHYDIPSSPAFLRLLRAGLTELDAPRQLRADSTQPTPKRNRDGVPWIWTSRNKATVP